MSRLKSIVGWMVRGGDQTRTELASQTSAIQELQRHVEDLRATVDAQLADNERVRAEVRGALDDVSTRLSGMTERIDHLDARAADQEASMTSLARVAAPPAAD